MLVIPFSASTMSTILLVAIDVVVPTVIVPMFGCSYGQKFCAREILPSFGTGEVVRIVLQLVHHRDGSFLLPYISKPFLNYGIAANLKVPLFVDNAADRV